MIYTYRRRNCTRMIGRRAIAIAVAVLVVALETDT